jgi:hypothetical protein
LQEFEVSRFQDNRHMKVVRLSALCTGRIYPPPPPPGNIPGTHFCYRLSRYQGHRATGKIMSVKNSSYTIANGTGDLLACSAVPQPTACPIFCVKFFQNISPPNEFKTSYACAEMHERPQPLRPLLASSFIQIWNVSNNFNITSQYQVL